MYHHWSSSWRFATFKFIFCFHEHISNLILTFFQKFLQPLFDKPEVCEENLVRFMLYKLPEILKFHQNFLLKLDAVVHLWSDKSRIGPLLLETVSPLVTLYISLSDNKTGDLSLKSLFNLTCVLTHFRTPVSNKCIFSKCFETLLNKIECANSYSYFQIKL